MLGQGEKAACSRTVSPIIFLSACRQGAVSSFILFFSILNENFEIYWKHDEILNLRSVLYIHFIIKIDTKTVFKKRQILHGIYVKGSNPNIAC